MSSDGSTPEKQAEQIMAIYPVVKGQKPPTRNAIPPRGSSVGPSSRDSQADQQDDLIDFGQNDDAPRTSQNAAKSTTEIEPKIDSRHQSTAEIQSMLSATGSPAPDGVLLDFHEDLKKDLPRSLKRGDTEESHDEFVDALE